MEQAKKKKSILLLVSGIIGLVYFIYVASYFAGANTGTTGSSGQLAAAIATALVLPHMVLTLIALIFNWIGFFTSKSWAALVAGILYAVAIVLFFAYFWGVLVEMILCFIAFAQLRKKAAPTATHAANTDITQ